MKKVIIIGASSGIGKELAKIFVAKNYIVGITGRRKELLEELKNKFSGKIFIRSFDVMQDYNTSELQHLIDEMGGMDVLIISAGVGYVNPQLEWQPEQETIETNVKGFTEIAAYGFNFFKKQNSGHLVAITSIAAIRGEGRAAAYNASKAYQANYLEGLRKLSVMEKLNIYITDIQPGFVKTKMAKGYKRFWEAPVQKAAMQVYKAIENKKKKVYITKRWWLIAQILKIAPGWLYNKV